MPKFLNKKRAVVAGVAVVALGGGMAYAYWTTSGSGQGNATTASDTALVVHQDSIVYANAGNENAFVPGSTATVSFSVDNASSGHEYVTSISLASVTSTNAACNTDLAAHPGWFTMSAVTPGVDVAPGHTVIAPTGTVTFVNDPLNSQDNCKASALVLHYTSN